MAALATIVTLYVTAGEKLAKRSVYALAEATGLPVEVVRELVGGAKERNLAKACAIAKAAGLAIALESVHDAPASTPRPAKTQGKAIRRTTTPAPVRKAPVASPQVAPVLSAPARKRGNPYGRHPVTGHFLSRAQHEALTALRSLSA